MVPANYEFFVTIYYILSILCAIPQPVFPWGEFYHGPHFTDEETKAQRERLNNSHPKSPSGK
jgi:hypothetical protein